MRLEKERRARSNMALDLRFEKGLWVGRLMDGYDLVLSERVGGS